MAGQRRSPEVDAIIDRQTGERREALIGLRDLVLEVAQEAQETVTYRIPTYAMDDAMVCAFAAQKRYLSLYVDTAILDRYRSRLAHLSLGKGCIRFRRLDQLDLDLVRQMLSETVDRPPTTRSQRAGSQRRDEAQSPPTQGA